MLNIQETTNTSTEVFKLALSVNKDFNPLSVTLQELIEKPTFLAKRPYCETDESALQLIPYITLVDDSNEELKYFVYTRGKASGEQRLAGKCSVGLGGHIEQRCYKGELDSIVINSVAETAVKEIQEEIGLDIPFHLFANAMLENYAPADEKTSNQLYINKAKLLYNTSTRTDVVHLGISFIIKAKPANIKNLELDVITRGRWMTYREIEEAESSDNPIELEVWSKVVIARVNLNSFKNNYPV